MSTLYESFKNDVRQTVKPPDSPAEFKARINQAKVHVEFLASRAELTCSGHSENARVARAEIMSRRIIIDGVLTWMPQILDAYKQTATHALSNYAHMRLGMLTLVSQLHAFLKLMSQQEMGVQAQAYVKEQLEALDVVIAQLAPEGLEQAIGCIAPAVDNIGFADTTDLT